MLEYKKKASEAQREILEQHRKKNSLVDRVIKGETTITAEFYKVSEQFESRRAEFFYPHILNDKDYRELNEVIGIYPSTNLETLLVNPFFGAASFSLIQALFFKLGLKEKEVDRREFLKFTGSVGLLGAALGAYLGSQMSWEDTQDPWRAKMVDRIIMQIYRPQNIPIEPKKEYTPNSKPLPRRFI